MKEVYLCAPSVMQNGLLSREDIFQNVVAVKNTGIGIKFRRVAYEQVDRKQNQGIDGAEMGRADRVF